MTAKTTYVYIDDRLDGSVRMLPIEDPFAFMTIPKDIGGSPHIQILYKNLSGSLIAVCIHSKTWEEAETNMLKLQKSIRDNLKMSPAAMLHVKNTDQEESKDSKAEASVTPASGCCGTD